MTERSDSPLLLFYPTSPVHVRDIRLVIDKLFGWRSAAIVYNPLARVSPGVDVALANEGLDAFKFDGETDLKTCLPGDTTILALGAVFEPFALDLFAWAKCRQIPVIAIQEAAQLALNQFDINNYDAPFDRLFVASSDEYERFLDLGYPSEMLRISGLLANERFGVNPVRGNDAILQNFGIHDGTKPIVYTTSPLRGRLSLHNKDDLIFREAVLTQIGIASRRTGRRAVVKLHPNEDIEPARDLVQKIIPDAIVLGREVNIDELFPVTGVLVNRGNSQTSLEAVLRGVPTVIAACGLKTLFHDDGGAYVVDCIGELAEAIERAANQGSHDASRVKAKHFFLPPEGVANFIAKEISNLSTKPQQATNDAWKWLIKSVLFVGRHDRALEFCKQIKTRTPWLKCVQAALKAHVDGQRETAIEAWRECEALDHHWFFPHYELAHGFQADGQFEKATVHAHKAIELHPLHHSLWHEIPMRVVIMASMRNKGDLLQARTELNALSERCLVEHVPELLIEAAAQHCFSLDDFEAAVRCLEKAFAQLKHSPIDHFRDSQILERAVIQYVDLAGKLLEANDSAHSTASLTRAIEIARSDPTTLNHLSTQLGELGKKREMAADYFTAENCYALAIQADPTAHWFRFRQTQINLKQRNFRTAFKTLFTIARIPNAPKAIVERTLSSVGAARLAPFWPASPTSIMKPLTLWLCMSGWFFGKMLSSRSHDPNTSTTATILVWLFVARHFLRRLQMEFSKVRNRVYRIRSVLARPFALHGKRVTHCPICGAHGKFEYENKLTPLLRCVDCDHVWATNLPDDQTLNALYGDFGYWERDRYHQGITAIQEGEQWNVYLRARIGILEKLKLLGDPVRSGKKIFEIGCAEGMLLHELRKRGMDVMGCEMNQAVAAEGMKTLAVDILTSPFEALELPTKAFDLVLSFHTLEHLRDPASVLAKVANILRPEGALLLEVPCGEEEYGNTDHLHFFCDNSLLLLLNKFFVNTEILDNSYTNSAGVRIGSIYGFGHGVR
jgi:2-polyprenyl-3-methyl-5-hydroxy-6-metoxy-1,4-benzoquinol methylase/tetratricopeptide (TPR) repeat protein